MAAVNMADIYKKKKKREGGVQLKYFSYWGESIPLNLDLDSLTTALTGREVQASPSLEAQNTVKILSTT